MRRALLIVLGLLIPVGLLAGGYNAGIVRSWVFYPVNTAPRDTNGVLLDVTSASPPAIWVHPVATEPFFLVPGANATLVGQHGINGTGPITSKWWRGSCETADGGGHCQGWNQAENQGGGAATVVVDRITTRSAHGGASLMFTADNGAVPKYAYARGACQTQWINQDVTLIAQGLTLTGTASCSLRIWEWDNADCTGYLATQIVWGIGDPGAIWAELKGTLAAAGWNALTSSWMPTIWCAATGTAYTVTFDAAMALQAGATFDTDQVCTLDSDSNAVCSLQDITAIPPEHMSAWTFEAKVRSPIDGAVGAPYRQILFVPGTDENDENAISLYWDSDTLTCSVVSSAGDEKVSTVAAAGNADTDYSVKMSKTTDGIVNCCWDGTCDATPATGATTNAIGSEMIFGSDGTTGGEVWIKCGENEERCKLRRGAR